MTVSFFVPNAVATLRRPTVTKDAHLSPVETLATVGTDLPVHVVERSQRVWSPPEQRATITEKWRCRWRPGTDVREGDHVVLADGTYFVDTVAAPRRTFVGAGDVVTELTKVRR